MNKVRNFDNMELSPGVTTYIRMIGMIVVFLGVVIGDLVFLGSCSSEIRPGGAGPVGPAMAGPTFKLGRTFF